MITTENKEQLEMFGTSVHTALRKLCDSTPTCGAYTQIRAMPEDLWFEFIKAVQPKFVELNTRRETWAALKRAVKEAYDPYTLSHEAVRANKEDKAQFLQSELEAQGYHRQLLKTWFECFDDDDWKGAAGYLS